MNSGLWILEGINKCRGRVQQAATEEEDEKGRNVRSMIMMENISLKYIFFYLTFTLWLGIDA